MHHSPPPDMRIPVCAGVLCARLGPTCRCMCGHLLSHHAAAATAGNGTISTAAAAAAAATSRVDSCPSAATSTTSLPPQPSAAKVAQLPSFSRCGSCACRRFNYMCAASQQHMKRKRGSILCKMTLIYTVFLHSKQPRGDRRGLARQPQGALARLAPQASTFKPALSTGILSSRLVA